MKRYLPVSKGLTILKINSKAPPRGRSGGIIVRSKMCLSASRSHAVAVVWCLTLLAFTVCAANSWDRSKHSHVQASLNPLFKKLVLHWLMFIPLIKRLILTLHILIESSAFEFFKNFWMNAIQSCFLWSPVSSNTLFFVIPIWPTFLDVISLISEISRPDGSLS